MAESYVPSLSSLVQGFIYALTAKGKAPATIHYYNGNLRRFLWYANTHGWPEDPRMIDVWKLREFLTYAGNAKNHWGAEGNGSENCREPSRTGGWGDTLPDWLKGAITLERLLMNMKVFKGDEMTGTDAEACAYLYTAGLTAPMDHDWSQIYLLHKKPDCYIVSR